MISRRIIAIAYIKHSLVLVDTYKSTDGTPYPPDVSKPAEAGFEIL